TYRNLWRHWRFERIDDRFDNDRAGRVQSLLDETAAVVRIFDRDARSSARLGKQREVDRLQLASIFRIAEEYHLFPFDLAKSVVLDDEYLDRQLVFHARHELGHQHGESAVAHKCDALPVGIRNLR